MLHSLHSGASAGWSWREVTAREGKWTKKTVTKRAISKGSAVQCYGPPHHLHHDPAHNAAARQGHIAQQGTFLHNRRLQYCICPGKSLVRTDITHSGDRLPTRGGELISVDRDMTLHSRTKLFNSGGKDSVKVAGYRVTLVFTVAMSPAACILTTD